MDLILDPKDIFLGSFALHHAGTLVGLGVSNFPTGKRGTQIIWIINLIGSVSDKQ